MRGRSWDAILCGCLSGAAAPSQEIGADGASGCDNGGDKGSDTDEDPPAPRALPRLLDERFELVVARRLRRCACYHRAPQEAMSYAPRSWTSAWWLGSRGSTITIVVRFARFLYR